MKRTLALAVTVFGILTALVVAMTPGVALADVTTDQVWVTESVGAPNDPPTTDELAAMELAAATSKTCATGTWKRGYDDVYYVNDANGLVPVIDISHIVKWSGNCASVFAVTQTETATILSPGFQWRGWDPAKVVGKGAHVTATISGTYAVCPEGLTCVDSHHPFSSVVLYANGRSTETHGDPGATGGVGASTDTLPEIVPNVG